MNEPRSLAEYLASQVSLSKEILSPILSQSDEYLASQVSLSKEILSPILSQSDPLSRILSQEQVLSKPLSIGQVSLSKAQENGAKGGRSRAMKLSPERRQEIARNAIAVRWRKRRAKVPIGFAPDLQHD